MDIEDLNRAGGLVVERLRRDDIFAHEFRLFIAIAREVHHVRFVVDEHEERGRPIDTYRNIVLRRALDALSAVFRDRRVIDGLLVRLGQIFEAYGQLDNTQAVMDAERSAQDNLTAYMQLEQARVCAAQRTGTLTADHIRAAERALGENNDIDWSAWKPTPRSRPERNTPDRRAWALLARTVGRKRYRQIKHLGYFEVEGKRGTYRFHKDSLGGVTFIDHRKYGERTVPVEFSLCIQSQTHSLPAGDVIVSRYLSWLADEEQFLQTANFRRAHTPDEVQRRSA